MKCEDTRREIDFCSASCASETILQVFFLHFPRANSLDKLSYIPGLVFDHPALGLEFEYTLGGTGGSHANANASLSLPMPSLCPKTPQLSGNPGGRKRSGLKY